MIVLTVIGLTTCEWVIKWAISNIVKGIGNENRGLCFIYQFDKVSFNLKGCS